ncbi:DNA recombination protein RmuC [Serinibacter salmoneus]|uniref:DNA recombination protein RmuC n=1 Tax=Serinibacter salmoneus TaxID=556530 RepID=A0A2A9D141_9MICO|nr:DNA recombination protein RmuC [Serinibacter salmoneus]PFG20418.1 DNA recombination protein RmuC [Serinibacter salmoneus]
MDSTALIVAILALALGAGLGYLLAGNRAAARRGAGESEAAALRTRLEAAEAAHERAVADAEQRLGQVREEAADAAAQAERRRRQEAEEAERRRVADVQAEQERGARQIAAEVQRAEQARAEEQARAAEALSAEQQRAADQLAATERRHQAEQERMRADHAQALESLRADTKRMSDEFEALSAKALAANAKSFLEQAEERLKRTEQASAAELAKREEAVKQLVEPLTRTLGDVKAEMTEAEKARLAAHTALAEQVKGMQVSSEQLRAETNQLVTALRAPQVRGAWGEMQLRRTVEIAGMVEHVDFEEQVQVEGGALRPDLVVTLPDGKQIVVDAKVAFNGYLEAMEARDDETRRQRLAAHARHMRKHVDQLSSKEYWAHLDSTPEFTVMFVPSEVFLNAAMEQDPTLQEHAFSNNVVVATPATLVALLRTVAYTWRQEQLATEAKQVFTVGRELHKRLQTFGKHLEDLAKRLNGTVETFNKMTASLDSRVVPQIRRFSALQGLDDDVQVPPPLEVHATPAAKADLYPGEAAAAEERTRVLGPRGEDSLFEDALEVPGIEGTHPTRKRNGTDG